MTKTKNLKKKIKANRSLKILLTVFFSVMFFLFLMIQKRNVPCLPCSQPEINKLIAFVDEAASLITQKGEESFAEFKKTDSQWFTEENYVFVYDFSGKTLVLPPQPYLEGTNRLSIKDTKGIYFVKEMINQLKDRDFGWLQYHYPKPGESETLPKLAYFKKVNFKGKILIVGSGVYLK